MNFVRMLMFWIVSGFQIVVSWLLMPFHYTMWLIGELFVGSRHRDMDDIGSRRGKRLFGRIVSGILAPLRGAWILVRYQIPEMILDKQNRMTLILGIPALGVVGVALFFIVLALLNPVSRKIRMYERDAFKAFESGDFETARMCYDRLIRLQPETPRFHYQLGLVRDATNDIQGAKTIMSQLAPEDRVGYEQAHAWMAKYIFAQGTETPKDDTPEEQAEVIEDWGRRTRHHIEAGLAGNPDERTIKTLNALKASLEERVNPPEALVLYRSLVRYEPRLLAKVAELEQKLGQPEQATKTRQQLKEYIEEQELADRPVDAEDLVEYCKVCVELKEFETAFEASAHYSLDIDPGKVRLLQGDILVEWARDDLNSNQPDRYPSGVDKLLGALQLSPRSGPAYALMGDVGQKQAGLRAEFIEAVEELIASGTTSSNASLMLGGLLLMNEEYERAERYLNIANRLEPNSPAILNNLAWVNAFRDDGQNLEQALAFADQAIRLDDTVPDFYDTRGRIYIELGRPEDAVVDLTKALTVIRTDPTLFEACAKAYEMLGDVEQAKDFLENAEKLRRHLEESSSGSQQRQSANTGT